MMNNNEEPTGGLLAALGDRPGVVPEIGPESVELRARITDGAERDRLGEKQQADWPGFEHDKSQTERIIRVVIREPR